MLFPTEAEYLQWFEAAGFTDVQLKRIGPAWYRGVRRHGLIMGCSVTATKPAAGPSPLQLGPKAEASGKVATNPLSFLLRVVLGSLGGFWYFVLPIYMWCAAHMGGGGGGGGGRGWMSGWRLDERGVDTHMAGGVAVPAQDRVRGALLTPPPPPPRPARCPPPRCPTAG